MNIIHLISNKVWGGGERYALDLCRALEQRGHSTAVITRKGHPEVDAPFVRAGIAVGHLPLRGAIDILSPLILSRILDRMETPVAIHVHNFKDAVVALATSCDPQKPENSTATHTATSTPSYLYPTPRAANL